MNHRVFKPIALTVLFFFCWTFAGGFDVAYAIKNSSQHTVDSSQGNPTKNSQKSKTQRPEEKFQKTIEDIEQILTDTSTDTDTKKNKIKNKKSEIEGLDVEIKKQFSDTEKKLKDEGLPNEILERLIFPRKSGHTVKLHSAASRILQDFYSPMQIVFSYGCKTLLHTQKYSASPLPSSYISARR